MGEKFAANALTGTATLSVPLTLTAARSGAEPVLALGYDSGSGNGPFGLCWSLDVPSVSRRTDKGLPRYADERDVFQLSGAEDLVPAQFPAPRTEGAYEVISYRPRTEGLFARIDRLREAATGDTHWRVTSKENVTSVFGRSRATRVADPTDSARVFRWLLEETADDRGNLIRYEYKPEDGPASANRYLKRIHYGLKDIEDRTSFGFQVVLDYGEHDDRTPTPQEVRPWPARADPFSSRRSGFEIRTERLCRRILMFHQFPELAPDPVLVSSTDLTYQEDPATSKLTAVTRRGYAPSASGDQASTALPALEFTYTERTVSAAAVPLRTEPGDPPPRLDAGHRWVDLDGEGIPGLLAEQDGARYYRPNRGDGLIGAPRLVDPAPSTTGQLMDLAGDGRQSLATLSAGVPGYHRRTEDRSWAAFEAFPALPRLQWEDPNLRFVDLTGDGLADVLLTGSDGFTWYPSRGFGGYADGEDVAAAATEDRGPALVFADPEQSVYLADMTGDGLTDLVRIRNGEIAYWPSLGHGRFGPRITMAGAPVFDHPDRFAQSRIRLADVDGSAPTDIIYLGDDGARVWFNQAGNSWSAPETVIAHIPADAGVTVADLLGKGTACLVIAGPAPHGEPEVHCLDLMAAGKPHLLAGVDNGMGLRTTVSCLPSTAFYLADEGTADAWLTRLPFPVHVVAETRTEDAVAGTTLVSSYRYRHGHYDGVEREFRGFAFVEHRDALSYEASGGREYEPPAVTRRWQHTGDTAAVRFADRYWNGGAGPLLPDTVLPGGLSVEEEREAVRALRGRVLREEVYAEGADGELGVPYAVAETNHRVRVVQPRGTAEYCVVHAHDGETLTVHREGVPDDLRVTHDLTLDVDEWGVPRRVARAAYPGPGAIDPAQTRMRLTVTEYDVTNTTDTGGTWRLGTPVEQCAYEIGGIAPRADHFTETELRTALAGQLEDIPYHRQVSGTRPQRRLLSRTRHTYSADDLGAELPPGRTGSRALPWRIYRQAYAEGQLTYLYGDRISVADLESSGHLRDGDIWWSPSGRHEYSPAAFYQPVTYTDPFGARWTIGHDPHLLRIARVADPLDSRTTATLNYRVVELWLLTDPNGNRTGVRYDALGFVTATAVLGKPGAADDADRLDLSTPEPSAQDDPTTTLEYDLDHLPVAFRTRARERHGDPDTPWQESRTYGDGTGRIVLVKTQAEPAVDGTPRWIGTGRVVYDDKGRPVKQYEPYFAPGPGFDAEDEFARHGVAAVLHYDPLGRLVRTDHPDGTRTRAAFTPWGRTDADRNDTVRGSRWLDERMALPPGDPRRRAAEQTLFHADTPTVTELDVLGRPFRVTADNGGGELFTTATERDVDGRELALIDPRGIRVWEQQYDMLGRVCHASGPDAGERWSLTDVTGNLAYATDSRGTVFRWVYDQLRRVTHAFATPAGRGERLRARTYYGEALAHADRHNLRGRICLAFDTAGAVRTTEVDVKGNITESVRRLTADPAGEPDWAPLTDTADPDVALTAVRDRLEADEFPARIAYDALNRETLSTSPDGARLRLRYGEGGLLDCLELATGAEDWRPLLIRVDYNARRQRTQVRHGNGVRTAYTYDPATFRLSAADSSAADGRVLQRLEYTYDPVGNVTEARDPAQDTVFFANTAVGAVRRYVYDATYRLISATGREHIGQTGNPGPVDPALNRIPHVNDSSAFRAYTQTYRYDPSGNLTTLAHAAGTAGWTQRHEIAPGSNRLLGNSVPGDGEDQHSARYSYDARGNITAMPHLDVLDWDVENRFAHAGLGGGGDAHYQYDGSGNRVRATVDRGGTVEERVYCGRWERYRKTVGGGVRLERTTLHVTDGATRFAVVETTAQGELLRFQLSDLLGSAIVELDADARVLSYEEYHPYGTTSYRSADSAAQTSLKRYRFTGKERDTETGFTYHGARYYAPWLARWTAPDPTGFPDGTNLYAYARCNPVVLSDPSGRESERQEIYRAAHALLEAHDKGLVEFDDDIRDKRGKVIGDGGIAKQVMAILNAKDTDPLPKNMTLGMARIIQRMVDKAEERRAKGEVTGVDFSIMRLAVAGDRGHGSGQSIDISKYAGKSLKLDRPEEHLDAVATFYSDMIGHEYHKELGRSENTASQGPAVDTTFAIGTPRNPRRVGSGAVEDSQMKDKAHMYTRATLTPQEFGKKSGSLSGGRGTTMTVPVLKPEYQFDDVFFPRDTPVYSRPGISHLMPAARSMFEHLKDQDTQHVLQGLFPDGIGHFHVQIEQPRTPHKKR
ncbi:SpvB/TcaC N-terminal domain-containing protein [Streptomyces sp. R21]|uniref:SpvB/TcaC N-terminal domain-containing protein n=1 Tax=Streptomyces sp. R21 TaxID=3238627 RepID=A0AB39P553_9ACTN